MSITKHDKKTSEFLVTVSSDKTEWKQLQENAFKTLKSNLVVKGFRKGKAPEKVAKQNISQEDIFTKAITKALDKLVVVASKELPKNLMILDSPSYKVDKISDAELEVTFIYPVYPEVKLIDYKNLKTKFKPGKTSAKDIEDELKKLQIQHSLLVSKKSGTLQKKDTAIFDFEGFVDKKPFEGGKAENYELEIGSGKFIVGFEDQMIGMKKGESKNIKVSFPKEYQIEVLAGKPAVFKIKLNDIKIKEVPKLNDEFVKGLSIPKAKTLEELKKYIKKINKEQKNLAARNEFMAKAFSEIKEKVEINVPAGIIAKDMQNVKKQFEQQLEQQGLTLQQYQEITKMDNTTLASQFKLQSIERLKDSFIFAEIAKKEKVKLVNADYEKEYKKLAKVYKQKEEEIKKMITKDQMQVPMTNDRVLDILIENNK